MTDIIDTCVYYAGRMKHWSRDFIKEHILTIHSPAIRMVLIALYFATAVTIATLAMLVMFVLTLGFGFAYSVLTVYYEFIDSIQPLLDRRAGA